jgi:PPK2 family polyphosphate:nucleotide phosphotransferase
VSTAALQSERWRVAPGSPVSLDALSPDSTSGAPGDRDTTASVVPVLQDRLRDLQERLWAEGRRALLVVLQGVDAAGKDGTIKHVFTGMNPQGTRVTSFKEPTSEELAHDFLWRVHRHVPRSGEIGIFNRSHYEDVIVVRVDGLVTREVWSARYEHINAFERLLSDGGTTIVKVFLHISYEEQGRRLQERLVRPDKRWKINRADIVERSHWSAYRAAYTDVLERTSTDTAPWYVVPADHKWFRNWAVSRILVDVLTSMNPRYPESSPMDGVTIT